MLRGPPQSSRCPAIPKTSSSGSSQSSCNRDLRILQSRRIATGFRILDNPEAIQMDCAPIGPELRPLRLRLDCDSRSRVGALTRGSSRCPAVPKTSSSGWSQSIPSYCNPDDCGWITDFMQSRGNSDGLLRLHQNCSPRETMTRIASGL